MRMEKFQLIVDISTLTDDTQGWFGLGCVWFVFVSSLGNLGWDAVGVFCFSLLPLGCWGFGLDSVGTPPPNL